MYLCFRKQDHLFTISPRLSFKRLYGENIQLEVAFSDLILGNRIGQGACSSVNVARHKRTGEVYAIKMFNVYDKGQASQLYNEILLLTSFQCDCLISLKGAFHDEGSIGVILEYMDKGSLEFLMDEKIEISERVMAGISFQILWGLGYLHYEKQIHRDVKAGNILMVRPFPDHLTQSVVIKYSLHFTVDFSVELVGPGEAVGFWHFERTRQLHRHVEHLCGLVPVYVARTTERREIRRRG